MNLEDFLHSIIQATDPRNFFYLSKKYSTEFTRDESDMIVKYLQEIECRFGIDLGTSDGIRFFWNKKMDRDKVTACWSGFKKDYVFVTEGFHFDCKSDGFKRLVAPIGHEMTHRIQFCSNPVKYFLCKIPVIRNFTIEVEANKISDLINKHFKTEEL